MNIMPGLKTTASALNAEKVRLDLIGQNIANAHTTKGPDGKPYARQVVSFEAQLMQLGRDSSGHMKSGVGVQVGDIRTDNTPGQKVFNPGHPDANEDGYVEMPNVNITHEMVDMIAASRAYEANLEVVKTSKQLAQNALRMGK